MTKQEAAAREVVRWARNLLTERKAYGEAHKSFYDELRDAVKKYDAVSGSKALATRKPARIKRSA